MEAAAQIDRPSPTAHRRSRRGFTLVEAVISTLIIATLMVSALRSIENTGRYRNITSDRQVAFLLGEQLMSEILAKPYSDPSNPWGTIIGRDPGETTTLNRSSFDDVDDYHNWLEQPPQLSDGTLIANRLSWYRLVTVQFVRENLEVPVTTDCGLKRITVEVGTVFPGGLATNATARKPLATLVAIAGRGRM